jgi:hypothetical protein
MNIDTFYPSNYIGMTARLRSVIIDPDNGIAGLKELVTICGYTYYADMIYFICVTDKGVIFETPLEDLIVHKPKKIRNR